MESEIIESKIEHQFELAQGIQTLYENFKKEPIPNRTIPFLTVKLRHLQNCFTKFDNNNDFIVSNIPNNQRRDLKYFKENVFKAVEDISLKMQLRIEEWKEKIIKSESQQFISQQQTINQQQNDSNVNTTFGRQRQNEVRLPRVNIEQFSGDYRKWTSFKNIFKTLIHDKTDIPTIEKFYYLKSHVTGEAARLVNHYTITEPNYETAWNTLNLRYDNNRILINMELKALIEQPTMNSETATQIRNLLDTTAECLNSLKNLQIDTSTWNPILIFILVKKFSPDTLYHWELSLTKPKEVPTIKHLLDFLESRFNTLENLPNLKSSQPYVSNSSFSRNKSQHWQTNNRNEQSKPSTSSYQRYHAPSPNTQRKSFLASSDIVCELCNGNHRFFNCDEFIQANPEKRKHVTLSLQQCVNCLHNHDQNTCRSLSRCKKCNQQHHTLLHVDEQVRPSENITQTISRNPFSRNTVASSVTESLATSSSSHFAGHSAEHQILLATALVKVIHNHQCHILRCLIDQGSQSSFITEDAAQRLKLNRIPINASISGLGSTTTATSKNMVTININSVYDNNFILPIDAIVLSKITGIQPSYMVSLKNCNHLAHLELADPEYYKPNKIDVLLGADVYGQIICNGLRKGTPNTPIAQNTNLGWILSGKTNIYTHISVTSLHQRTDLDKQLRLFWEQEELQPEKLLNDDENKCEQIFKDTHYRDNTGRYVVALPFKSADRNPLGNSKYRALSRLQQLEKRLGRNVELRSQYSMVLNEYEELGHMIPATAATKNEEVYYLPHHCVIKESSRTTKVRVVFDASAKTSSGESLNDQLLVGPTIQEDLYTILLRWRRHRVVMAADIQKMYRQIRVQKSDTNFQRILWRVHPNQIAKEFQLTTVTFGNAAAPFLASRVLRQLAIDESKYYSEASKVVLKDFYVDDLLTGVDEEDDAIHLQRDITKLLLKGGFELCQWISNSERVLQHVPMKARQETILLDINMDETTKTLGLHYHPKFDTFQFKINLTESHQVPTKRILLSETARLFDPMGWLGPVIIKAKIFFQELWKKELTWDQHLDKQLTCKWLRFRKELKQLEEIRITRWLHTKNSMSFQLHGFSDASEAAYAAVIYARVVLPDDTVQITMITSKTRVAPIKLISLPRLELCAAALLKNLLEKTKIALEFDKGEMFAWTDSKVVLAWLNSNPAKWKSYVAHRVTDIHSSSQPIEWNYVSTKENPADCASRGIYPHELQDHSLWWEGPKFLKKSTFDKVNTVNITTNIDIKNTHITSHLQTQSNNELTIIEKFSSLNKLIRCITMCLRFAYNCKNPVKKRTETPMVAELKIAESTCIKLVQQQAFPDEYTQLKNCIAVHKKSRLLTLNPFMDADGLIRVGGRLQKTNLSYEQKHQIILPTTHHLTMLIINDAHIRSEHGGIQLTMNIIRKKFWILHTRKAVKNILNKCICCFKFKKNNALNQIMASLPSQRLLIARPFTNVGVDYAGPLMIKASMLRSNKMVKGYIALFICMSTKAVHIEVVSDLSTQAFLAAFNRFAARRGLPANIHSDNGTNFVGADRELRNIFKKMIANEMISKNLADRQIQWHFIPPRSPHFGGLWEAGVKSLKHHLNRTVGNALLTFEELYTVLTQIEACLNSRPLQPLTEDCNDFSALTPGHFLIGSELLAPPQEDYLNVPTNRLQKWRRLAQMYQQFWNRWSTEYLNNVQQRYKWKIIKNDIAIGDMVLLKEDNMPPNKWRLCRIEQLHPGSDSHTRVVTLRTPDGITKRPITKICPLPQQ